MVSTGCYLVDMHHWLNANHLDSPSSPSSTTRKNGTLIVSSTSYSNNRHFLTSFRWGNIDTYVKVGNRQKTSWMPHRCSTGFSQLIRRRGQHNQTQRQSFATWERRKWVELRDTGAEGRHQLDHRFCFSLVHFFSHFVGPSTDVLGTGFTCFRWHSTGGGVSPFTRSAELSWDVFYHLFPSM